MSFSGNQRRVYLLALTLLIVAVALACTWSLWGKVNGEPTTPIVVPQSMPDDEPSAEPEADLMSRDSEATAQSAPDTDAAILEETSKVSTIVYYQDNYGYLVPVMCSVPMEDGIAKATLNLMVQSSANDLAAARLGLKTTEIGRAHV